MIAKLKGMNYKIGLIDDPNITAAGSIADYVYADTNGYFVKDKTGNTKQITWPWGSNSGLVDFFNPTVRKWWGDQHNMILKQGVEVFWVDMNEPARHNVDWLFWNRDGKAYGTLNEVKNAYGTVHNQTMFDKVHENGKRSIILTRSGFTGVHRYSSPWTGDISAVYTSTSASSGISGLAEQIRMGTNLSFTGYNYWGFDIGGFFGSIDNKLYKRWIELA
jgi:alpha-glucosidase